tara:strand:- start:295 stop:1491 length:1197 start_codon:yes stop_codon:yes gene_type:complete
MNQIILLIGLTVLVAIIYVIVALVGGMNKVSQLVFFSTIVSSVIGVTTYFKKDRSKQDIIFNSIFGIFLILMATTYLFLPVSHNITSYVLLGSVFTSIFGILYYISVNEKIHTPLSIFRMILTIVSALLFIYFSIHFLKELPWWAILTIVLLLFFVFDVQSFITNKIYGKNEKEKKKEKKKENEFLKKWKPLINNLGNKDELIMLILGGGLGLILFKALPDLYSYIYSLIVNQGGKDLLHGKTQSLMDKKIVASYKDLRGEDEPGYNYSISFWVYINSMQQTSELDNEIFSYGTSPIIKYNPSQNKFMFMTNDGVLSKIEDVELQKWNNIIINYVNGTMDIFYNGKLSSSHASVVPYVKDDVLTIGTNGTLYGSIKKLVYFKKSLNIYTVNKLYNIQQ